MRTRPDQAIGAALLDQLNLAGIGKCVALFVAHINPWPPVLAVTDLRGLVVTAQRLMRANRDHPEQSTTGLCGRRRTHWVYQRSGEAWLRCRTPITYAEPATRRGTYWCPSCQPPLNRDSAANYTPRPTSTAPLKRSSNWCSRGRSTRPVDQPGER